MIKPFWRWEKEPVDPAVVGTKLINYTLPRVSIVSFQGQSAATVGSSIIGVFRPNDSLLNPPALDVSQLVDPLPRQRTSIFDVSMRSCGPHPTRGPAEALVCHPHHTHTHRWTASCVCVSGCHFYLIKSNRCLLDSRPLRTCFFVLFSSVSARVAEGHRVHLVFSSCKFSRRGIHRQICRPSPPNIRADK